MELVNLQKAGLLLSGAVYVGSVLWLWRGLSGRRSGPALVSDQPSVSTIVAARDEEATLPQCLDALAQQDYQGAFEVIVVDDRSREPNLGRHSRKGGDLAGTQGCAGRARRAV